MTCSHQFVTVRASGNLIERRQCWHCGLTDHDIVAVQDNLWAPSSPITRDDCVTNREKRSCI